MPSPDRPRPNLIITGADATTRAIHDHTSISRATFLSAAGLSALACAMLWGTAEARKAARKAQQEILWREVEKIDPPIHRPIPVYDNMAFIFAIPHIKHIRPTEHWATRYDHFGENIQNKDRDTAHFLQITTRNLREDYITGLIVHDKSDITFPSMQQPSTIYTRATMLVNGLPSDFPSLDPVTQGKQKQILEKEISAGMYAMIAGESGFFEQLNAYWSWEEQVVIDKLPLLVSVDIDMPA
jgi:hypothetical protein